MSSMVEALAAHRDERVGPRQARTRPGVVELDVGAGLRAGQLGHDVRHGTALERGHGSSCGGRSSISGGGRIEPMQSAYPSLAERPVAPMTRRSPDGHMPSPGPTDRAETLTTPQPKRTVSRPVSRRRLPDGGDPRARTPRWPATLRPPRRRARSRVARELGPARLRDGRRLGRGRSPQRAAPRRTGAAPAAAAEPPSPTTIAPVMPGMDHAAVGVDAGGCEGLRQRAAGRDRLLGGAPGEVRRRRPRGP